MCGGKYKNAVVGYVRLTKYRSAQSSTLARGSRTVNNDAVSCFKHSYIGHGRHVCRSVVLLFCERSLDEQWSTVTKDGGQSKIPSPDLLWKF